MSLNLMKYKNYTFPHNPSKLNIASVRDIKEIVLPFNGSVFQDYGRKKRIVKGIGNFFGSDCLEKFNQLFSIFKVGGTGYLALPGNEPFLAIFKSLELTSEVYQDLITYSFEFWEDMSSPTNFIVDEDSYHTVILGETLWTIAAKYEISVETLLQLNSSIKNPNSLKVGQKVALK